jgi:hypothetical protein
MNGRRFDLITKPFEIEKVVCSIAFIALKPFPTNVFAQRVGLAGFGPLTLSTFSGERKKSFENPQCLH